MKKLAVLAAGLGALALAVGPAIAADNGAKKATLNPAMNGISGSHCDKMPKFMTDQGFVIFNLPGQPGNNGTIMTETSLKGGTAGATYDIYIRKGMGSCQKLANPLTTNVEGNGNAHNTTTSVNGPTGPGMYQEFLENQNKSSDSFISEPVVTLN